MHLIFVDNLLQPYGGRLETLDIQPHLGLISLGAVAQQDGHQVTIVDPKRLIRQGQLSYNQDLYETFANMLLKKRPDAIGFTTLGCSFIFAIKVATFIKKVEPDLPILLGGPHATMLHQEILEQFPVFDVVVRHEAERTLPGVLAYLEQRDFKDIPGITWRTSSNDPLKIKVNPGSPTIENLDSLPIPSYELYPMKELGLDFIRVEAGRGCPFMCTFCSTATFFQRTYRLKSPQRLVNEMDILYERFGVTDFKLDHDLFTVDQKKVRAFCEAVEGRGYSWRVSARVDCVNENLLETMAASGCVGMYFGIETGSERMQKISKKKLNLDLVEPILDVTERLSIETTVSYITGYPEESQEDFEATLNMLGQSLNRDENLCIPQLHMLMPEPGTELYNQLGEQMQFDGHISDYNVGLFALSDEKLIKEHPSIFSTYYHYPTSIPRDNFTFAVDAFRELRKLGHTLLCYLLRYYEGSLSNLIIDFKNWAINTEGDNVVNTELILQYTTEKYGINHHVTSLVYYALGINRIAEQKAKNTLRSSSKRHLFSPDERYKLSPTAFLCDDMHNCTDLLAKIRQTAKHSKPQPLKDAEISERGYYLVVSDSKKDGAIENYSIDSGGYALINMFNTPHSYLEVAQAVHKLTDGMAIETDFFERLIQIGALVPAEQQELYACII